MFKQIRMRTLVAWASLLCVSSVNAGVIKDVIAQEDMLLWGEAITRTHVLTDDVAEGDVFVVGGPLSIYDGTFSLEFRDDNYDGDQSNKISWDFVGVGPGGEIEFGSGGMIAPYFTGDVTAFLNINGFIEVKITSDMGDFKVLNTEVVAYTTGPDVSVPEPGVLMLLGLGLVGLRVARPRKA